MGEFKTANFFYLCAHENHFNSTLLDLNSKIDTLDLNIKYFGFRWWHLFIVKNQLKKKSIEKFDLIIDLQTKIRNSLILKMIPHKFFVSATFGFFLSQPKINIKKDKKVNKTILKAVNKILGTKCDLEDFDINKINKMYVEESKRLLPKKNYVGFSITQGNVYRKKEWPINKIVSLCHELQKKNKTPVFFIEKSNSALVDQIIARVPSALFPEHDSDISCPALVTALSARLDQAISIDNGVMHMISLANIPMTVLFGPTNSQKFAPVGNKIKILDSKKIYKTNDINSIKVEDVLKLI